jgi:hypothetical protein
VSGKQIAFDLNPDFTHSWLDGKMRFDVEEETIVIHADKGKHADDPYILAEIPLADFRQGLRFLGVIE